jgi:hypothetical protein
VRNNETELGQELDVVAYVMLKERLRLEGGYGHFFVGDYVKTNSLSAANDSDFVFVQTGVVF